MASRNRCFFVILAVNSIRVANIDTKAIQWSESSLSELDASEAVALKIHALLDQEGYRGEPLMLALESEKCVSAEVALPSAKHARQRQTVGFLLEPQIPWASEEIVIDYRVEGAKAFVVAIQAPSLREIVTTLEARGVGVQSIVPLGVLKLEVLKQTAAANGRQLYVMGHEGKLDLWYLMDGFPVAWNRVEDSPKHITRSIDQWLLTQGPISQVITKGATCAEAISEDLMPIQSLEEELPRSLDDLAAGVAREILLGRRSSPFEFRRDALAPNDPQVAIRPQLRALTMAVTLSLLMTALAFWMQAQKQETLRSAYHAEQAKLHERVFPKQRVPVGVQAKLQSELDRLRGVRGEAGELPATIEAVTVLEQVLLAIPNEMRFQLVEVHIENGNLHLDGRIRAHSDADKIATALRNRHFDVKQPKTKLLTGKGPDGVNPAGVDFNIVAKFEPTDSGPREEKSL